MQWLPRRDIDVVRWDAAIAEDPRPLPYGLHWWLDIVAPEGWSGVMLDDYRAVLPLPRVSPGWQQLLPGLSSVAHRMAGPGGRVQRPPFSQQLGPFGKFSPREAHQLLRFAAQRASLKGFPTASSVSLAQLPDGLPTRRRTNLVLSLQSPYEAIFRGYSKTVRKQLRKATAALLTSAPPDLVIGLYREELGAKTGLRSVHFRIMDQLIRAAEQRGCGYCYQLKDQEGRLLAAGFFPAYQNRVINLFAASTAWGYENRGMDRLLDAVIRKYQSTASTFDFEGSDLDGVKQYFQSFGPDIEYYWSIG